VKLAGDHLVLDTNVLVHWLRGKDAGAKLRNDYALGARSPRPIVPVVVKAEIKSLALQFKWGTEKQGALDELLRELPVAEISSDHVIAAYAELDYEGRKRGRRMGKNDLWIAAVAKVQGAVILTTDQDFDDLAREPALIRVERGEVANRPRATERGRGVSPKGRLRVFALWPYLWPNECAVVPATSRRGV
jgi:tRNA(fMet)-specific endonuclease VapC